MSVTAAPNVPVNHTPIRPKPAGAVYGAPVVLVVPSSAVHLTVIEPSSFGVICAAAMVAMFYPLCIARNVRARLACRFVVALA